MQPGFHLCGEGCTHSKAFDAADPGGYVKDLAEAAWRQAFVTYFYEQSERVKARLEPGIPKSRKAIDDLGERLDAAFWAAEEVAALAILVPLMADLAAQAVAAQAAALEAATGVVIDWTATYADAAGWARAHAGELIGGILENTQKAVGEIVATWIETPGATMGDLFAALGPDSLFAFSESRAQMIAVTEVTSAYAEGGAIAAQSLEEYFTIIKTWHTNNDAIAMKCLLCWPLEGESVEGVDGMFSDGWVRPQRHPRCRCWLTYSARLED